MKFHALGLAAVLALSGTPVVFTGCDREVAHDQTTKTNPDGSQTKNETTVTQKPDGTTVKEQEKSKTPAPVTP